MTFVDPKNDVAFNKIFGNIQKKEIIISFLNAVLELTGDREISDVARLNPLHVPKIESFKYTLLNMRAKDKRGITFIVEMQVYRSSMFDVRFSIFNTKHQTSNTKLETPFNSIIFIGILDFTTFEGEDYLTKHLILNTSTYKQELKNFEFHFIELPKFIQDKDEVKTRLEKWLYFLKYANELDTIPKNVDFQALKLAYEIANPFSWSREELEVYEYWDMKVQDERGALQIALEEGEQKGRIAEKQETACKMLAKGYNIFEIAEITGLFPTEIAELSEGLS